MDPASQTLWKARRYRSPTPKGQVLEDEGANLSGQQQRRTHSARAPFNYWKIYFKQE